MSITTIPKRVLHVISEIADDTPNNLLDESISLRTGLGMDEIDVCELALNLEHEFGITIIGDEEDRLQTVGDVVALVSTKLAQTA